MYVLYIICRVVEKTTVYKATYILVSDIKKHTVIRTLLFTAGKYYIKASIYMSKAHSRFGLYSKVLQYAILLSLTILLTATQIPSNKNVTLKKEE